MSKGSSKGVAIVNILTARKKVTSAIMKRVSKSQHTGSKTNEKVRQFANQAGINVPKKVSLSVKYKSDNGKTKFRTMVVDNPKVSSGSRYDAGHKFGQQNGGSGISSSNIFPQHPIPNRYPVKGRKFMSSQDWIPKKQVGSWREMEDKINRKAQKYLEVRSAFQELEWHK